MSVTTTEPLLSSEGHLVGNIPVRNIWLLFLFASNLAQFQGQFASDVEESPDFPSLIARLLCYAVDRRLRHNLSRGYQQREADLTRVRGRIDVLRTFTEELLGKGMIACRFEEFTFDTPRNRLVRAALDALSSRLGDAVLRHDCVRLAGDLGRQGVGGLKPSRAELSADRIGRHDADDLLMVTLARLVFDLVLPTEDAGGYAMTRVEKDAVLVRRLFEKAIGNFYKAELAHSGWSVQQGKPLYWQIEFLTSRAEDLFPSMVSDIILENEELGRRVVIDTKFTSVYGRSQHKEAVLKSGYIYQLYTYLRSQEQAGDPLSFSASGMFLHPVLDGDLDETVRIQGHEIRFATVDLVGSTSSIITRLKSLVPRA
ncbi:5-methylcytosine-specific restriction endonuclease system specificity protein McrC [Rhizobium leguminosarum bv. viciae]|uniref:5-methylcytosine-specific restriction endonuclease system specificity protein McrC n=1 Tax=Rhizobium leguminosarum TaxID=384 RepID=UPI000E0F65BD|nr:5-methylcytosine-specific restriction endonuclease system specificity protein McrC [Rhizobium leguminosarum]NEJ80342.1 5-methylcytosine-specific restriction endonuclease system specificity protein McrC [Rhizobium leguminosarum]TBY19161.1 5-methylcytosine-specific restriction endonuclease system specificity protein McrC [Rhizobium leguminosarum bv. viciae]TBY26692.1 5-methylcytosine-specific restriction endonuclease system specificity protein McrC [Rhizobium leguminosarum bv. viciae]TBY54145.